MYEALKPFPWAFAPDSNLTKALLPPDVTITGSFCL